jgi:hypothetical protein
MFTFLNRRQKLEEEVEDLQFALLKLINQIDHLEDYMGIEFFNGGKNKPHYRKKKQLKKRPVGRPSKVKVVV